MDELDYSLFERFPSLSYLDARFPDYIDVSTRKDGTFDKLQELKIHTETCIPFGDYPQAPNIIRFEFYERVAGCSESPDTSYPKLESISLKSVTFESLSFLAASPNLESISIEGANISDLSSLPSN